MLVKENICIERPLKKSSRTTYTQVHTHTKIDVGVKGVSFSLQLAGSRKIWERVMGTRPSPQTYEVTSVLLLGWTGECDDTEAASEVSPSKR
jgi:hypothetical protein